MKKHHTKNKGDLGVLKVATDLAEKGYGILTPMTEHEDFDLVAYKGQVFKKIQARYRTANKGVIPMKDGSSWADKNGNHRITIDQKEVDIIAIYCPDTNKCYYVPHHIVGKGGIKLRLVPAKNNQRARVNWAKDFEEVPWDAPE